MGLLKLTIFFITLLVLFIAIFISFDEIGDALLIPDTPKFDNKKIWKDVKSVKNATTVEPVFITVPEPMLKTLKDQLTQSIIPFSIPGSNFEYGMNGKFINELLDHWLNNYNWKIWENEINKMKALFTEIQGLRIHTIHLKPDPKLSKGKQVIPILLLHGWPSSFFEFYKLIPALQDPSLHDKFTFEIICPSLPGFGWSEFAEKPGMNAISIAGIMIELMDRLNVTSKYIVHGTDWGALVGASMAKLVPGRIAGYHTTMTLLPFHDIRYWIKLFVGSLLPRGMHFLSSKEIDMVYPFTEKIGNVMNRMGYFWLQSTRPDTVGVALLNSPIGLAAYISEKYLDGSNELETFLKSADGGFANSKITKDEIITQIMIYYLTKTIPSSMRLYREYSTTMDAPINKVPVRIPTGILVTPLDAMPTPKEFVRLSYRDIRQYTVWTKKDIPAGHFCALQYPKKLAKDIKTFVDGLYQKKEL